MLRFYCPPHKCICTRTRACISWCVYMLRSQRYFHFLRVRPPTIYLHTSTYSPPSPDLTPTRRSPSPMTSPLSSRPVASPLSSMLPPLHSVSDETSEAAASPNSRATLFRYPETDGGYSPYVSNPDLFPNTRLPFRSFDSWILPPTWETTLPPRFEKDTVISAEAHREGLGTACAAGLAGSDCRAEAYLVANNFSRFPTMRVRALDEQGAHHPSSPARLTPTSLTPPQHPTPSPITTPPHHPTSPPHPIPQHHLTAYPIPPDLITPRLIASHPA